VGRITEFSGVTDEQLSSIGALKVARRDPEFLDVDNPQAAELKRKVGGIRCRRVVMAAPW